MDLFHDQREDLFPSNLAERRNEKFLDDNVDESCKITSRRSSWSTDDWQRNELKHRSDFLLFLWVTRPIRWSAVWSNSKCSLHWLCGEVSPTDHIEFFPDRIRSEDVVRWMEKTSVADNRTTWTTDGHKAKILQMMRKWLRRVFISDRWFGGAIRLHCHWNVINNRSNLFNFASDICFVALRWKWMTIDPPHPCPAMLIGAFRRRETLSITWNPMLIFIEMTESWSPIVLQANFFSDASNKSFRRESNDDEKNPSNSFSFRSSTHEGKWKVWPLVQSSYSFLEGNSFDRHWNRRRLIERC